MKVPSVLAANGNPRCDQALGKVSSADRAQVDLRSSTEYASVTRNGKDLNSRVNVAVITNPGNSGLSKGQKIIIYGPGRKGSPIHGFGAEDYDFKGVTLEPVKDPQAFVHHTLGGDPPYPIYRVKGRVPASEQSKALGQFIRDREKTLKSLASKAEYDGLSDKLKKDLLGWHSLANRNIVHSSFASAQEIRDPKVKAFVKHMLDKVSHIEIASDRRGYSVVGKPNYEITVTRLRTGEILGGTVTVHITGTETPGRQTGFRNESEAKRAGATDFETMWVIKGVYGEDLRELEEPYLDWAAG